MLARVGEVTIFVSFAADNKPEDMSAYIRSALGTAKQTAELADPKCFFLIALVERIVIDYARLHADHPRKGVMGKRPIELARYHSMQAWIGHIICVTPLFGLVSGNKTLAVAFYRK